ncbi:MAG: cytochrome c oxidase assembly protein [Gammaproteobacteria bacterium]
MFAFGFALVPLYNVFCSVTGLNGKTGGRVVYQQSPNKIDKQRWVTIEFVANKNENLPWDFKPMTARIRVHPGEMQRVNFFAANHTNHSMTIQAIPSVAPGIAAKYLKKTECFCFTKQTFAAKQAMEMPVLFHIDKELPDNVNTITLSYTLFDLTQQQGAHDVSA